MINVFISHYDVTSIFTYQEMNIFVNRVNTYELLRTKYRIFLFFYYFNFERLNILFIVYSIWIFTTRCSDAVQRNNHITWSQDPGLWCNTAFQMADVVLVVTSPQTSVKFDATIIYRNVDNHLLRLLKENYPRRNKRYYAIQLPYCKSDHIPEEARLFKKFRIPEDLARLVKTIHGVAYLRASFFTASNRELFESIRFATAKISEDEASSVIKNTEETGELSQILDFVNCHDNTLLSFHFLFFLDQRNFCIIFFWYLIEILSLLL